ncbi:MAG: biotin/lipoyl-binding protein [Candidatus Bathyarchaeota archaeon]|nr:MAG: biotin/lipoyl-binding protein [Candidatus Bathyarchaeota archaeon]
MRTNHENTALIELDGKISEVKMPKLEFDKKTSIHINGVRFKIKLEKNSRSMTYNIEANEGKFILQLERKRLKPIKSSLRAPPQFYKKEKLLVKQQGAVISLMPGRVVLLKVKVGDLVEAGDPLCIVEAMKMENEIVAHRSGAVTQVNVTQGSIVSTGDVLFIIGKTG